MKETDESIQEKQNYLRTEIKNKDYNVENFSEFMRNVKENWDDLNNWSFEELQKVVEDFKKQEDNNKKNQLEVGIENIRNSYHLPKEEEKILSNVPEYSYNLNKNNPYENILDNKEVVKNDNDNFGFELIGEEHIPSKIESVFDVKDIITCKKQTENSLSKLDEINIDIYE